MNLKMELINPKDAWNDFVNDSEQGVVFNKSEILEIYGYKVDYWIVFKKDMPKLAIAIIIKNKSAVNNLPFSYYQGPMFSKDVNELKGIKKFEWTTKILTFAIQKLTHEYRNISFSLHWSLNDIRPFTWFNELSPEKPNFNIKPKYTAIIDCRKNDSINDYILNIRRDRRQDLRYANDNYITIKKTQKTNEVLELYIETLKEKKIQVTDNESNILESLLNLTKNKKMGYILKAYNKNQEFIAAQFVLEDKYYSHGVALVGSKKANGLGVKTLLNLEWIKESMSKKLILDYNGANSPNLADYKHSMSAEPKIFFNVNLDK